MSKYNWADLKKKYMLGNYKSLREFAEENDINVKTLEQNSKGWVKEKKGKDREKEEKITERTLALQVEAEVSRSNKHLKAYDLALEACIEVLSSELRRGVDMFGKQYDSPVIIHSKLARIVESLEKIQKGQRLAEGLDDGPHGNDANINIIISPASADSGGE